MKGVPLGQAHHLDDEERIPAYSGRAGALLPGLGATADVGRQCCLGR